MLYLILDTATRRVNAGRVAKEPGWDQVRATIVKAWPGRAVKSPLERFAPGDDVVSVYCSPNSDGVGRADSKITLWLIGKE